MLLPPQVLQAQLVSMDQQQQQQLVVVVQGLLVALLRASRYPSWGCPPTTPL